MNRRHFISIIASAIGCLGCQFGELRKFAPISDPIEWNDFEFRHHYAVENLPNSPVRRGELWWDGYKVRIAE